MSTPGPNGKSPAELCGHQFKGILPVLNSKTNEHDSDLFSERKKSEKKKFDTKSKAVASLVYGELCELLKCRLEELVHWNHTCKKP